MVLRKLSKHRHNEWMPSMCCQHQGLVQSDLFMCCEIDMKFVKCQSTLNTSTDENKFVNPFELTWDLFFDFEMHFKISRCNPLIL